MITFLKQSLVIIISSGLVLLWQISPLSEFNIHLLSLIALIYFISIVFKKNKKTDALFLGRGIDIFLLNAAILILIFATGGINSGLFFLLYFLAFGIVFVFQAEIVFVSLLALTAVFISEAIQNDVLGHFLKLASLYLIYPIAYFFGRVYRESNQEAQKIHELEETASQAGDQINRDADSVLVDTQIPSSERKALEDIKSQTTKLQKASKAQS